MSKKLHVVKLPSSATNEDLSIRFATFGIVESADVVSDTRTGQSRCAGLVDRATEAAATASISGLNFTQYSDLKMSVGTSPSMDVD
jgi:RNA recognition motif-containing protein